MNGRMLTCAAAVLALCLAAGAARADEKTKDQPATSGEQKTSQDPSTREILIDATRVSTEKAVKGATSEKAKDKEATSEDPVSNDADDPAVTELRRIPPEKATKDGKTDEPEQEKEPKGGPLKDIHGSIHGSTGAGSRTTGAAVGASTRGGKTAIYVETQRNRETPVRH